MRTEQKRQWADYLFIAFSAKSETLSEKNSAAVPIIKDLIIAFGWQ
jgi:hypothetical protein